MKITGEFAVREFNDTVYAVPVGQTADEYKGAIKMNDTARMLWELLSEGTDREKMITEVLEAYDIDRETAEQDVDAFITTLNSAKLLED